MQLDPWLSENLACPRDKQPLESGAGALVCPAGHRYPVVDGIPVMLLSEVKQTHEVATRSLERVGNAGRAAEGECAGPGVHPFVQEAIGATNGIMYESLIGKLDSYPIPTLELPSADGDYFLDVGCNWGRWCLAASRLGYRPVGIDPNLEAVRTARQVARQLGADCRYVVADARYLPFREGAFDVAFSYSVLQHMAREDVQLALAEAGRVLGANGRCLIQMPNVYGLRCLYHQARRRFRPARDFEVRYWTPSDLKATFERLIGPAALSVDGFFCLNTQPSEAPLLPWRYRLVVQSSAQLRRLARRLPFLAYLADSLYVSASKVAR